MRNPAVGLRTNVRPYGKAAHCFSLIGTMNSLFFIDPNNENANLRVCAVGECRARNTGSRAIARLDPAPVSACYLQEKTGHSRFEPKGFWPNDPIAKR